MKFRADLHCHSSRSDGTAAPKELVALAKEAGLQGLSITDHDSVEAYREVFPEAKRLDLRLVTGAEFSSTFRGETIHVLAYSFHPEDPALASFCRMHQKRREERNNAILAVLAKLGFPVTREELQRLHPQGAMGRPHIALAMMQKRYVSSFSEAFRRFLGDGKPAYAPGNYPRVEETLSVIARAGAFSVLAHPHLIRKTSLIKELLRMPFDGMECYYAKMDPSRERRWLKLARERELLITGGSDFHGSIKPHIPLGCSWIGEETFSLLEERMRENLR